MKQFNVQTFIYTYVCNSYQLITKCYSNAKTNTTTGAFTDIEHSADGRSQFEKNERKHNDNCRTETKTAKAGQSQYTDDYSSISGRQQQNSSEPERHNLDTQFKCKHPESNCKRHGALKLVRVVLSPEAEKVYTYLKNQAPDSKKERTILNAINRKVELIKSNIHYGDPVAKNLIPEEYWIKYDAANLFRVELPSYWRMLYTLADGDAEIEIIAFVLDVFDHDRYNKKFGYRKR
jgi:hypothetical protein